MRFPSCVLGYLFLPFPRLPRRCLPRRRSGCVLAMAGRGVSIYIYCPFIICYLVFSIYFVFFGALLFLSGASVSCFGLGWPCSAASPSLLVLLADSFLIRLFLRMPCLLFPCVLFFFSVFSRVYISFILYLYLRFFLATLRASVAECLRRHRSSSVPPLPRRLSCCEAALASPSGGPASPARVALRWVALLGVR